jgi:hypothetical protein
MTDDSTDFERALAETLQRQAPTARHDLYDRAMADVAATPQRSRWAGWYPSANAAQYRWLAIAGVAAVAIVVGMTIGSSPLLTGADATQTPLSSVTPSSSSDPERWTEPPSYTFAFVSDCGERNGLGTFEVAVEDGVATEFRPLDELAERSHSTLDQMPTLGSLVRRVEEARQYEHSFPGRPGPSGPVPGPSAQPAIVTLETDPVDGHPTLIHIDWIPAAIDDEECYRILSYETYPTPEPTPMPPSNAPMSTPTSEPASPTPSAGQISWNEPSSYVFAFDSQCGLRLLHGRWEVTVEDGQVADYRSLANPAWQPFPGTEMPTLADLLSLVEDARADADAIVRAFEVDPEDGHPTRIDIDWLPNAIDDEECYVIEAYTPGA